MEFYKEILQEKANKAKSEHRRGQMYGAEVWMFVLFCCIEAGYKTEDDFIQNKKAGQIAYEAGVSRKFIDSVIVSFLSRKDVPFGPITERIGVGAKRKLTENEESYIVNRVLHSSITTRQLANELSINRGESISYGTIQSTLRRAGLVRKKPCSSVINKFTTENHFRTIEHHQMVSFTDPNRFRFIDEVGVDRTNTSG